MRRLRKTFLVVLTGILLAGTLVTATTIITGNHPDGYELEPELLPSENINATNATLRANLEEMDEVYDAALVYWNLTDTTTGETIRGPAATGFEQGKTVEADYVGLEPDAEYTVQAYAEPVVWDDDTLAENWGEKGLSNVPRGSDTALDAVASSESAMNDVAGSKPALDAVASSESAMDAVHSSVIPMESVWVEDEGSGTTTEIDFSESDGGYVYMSHREDTTGSGGETGVDIVTNVNVSDHDTLYVNWRAETYSGVYDEYNSGDEGRARVYVDGDRKVNFGIASHKSGASEETVREVDVSEVDGSVNIRIAAYANAYRDLCCGSEGEAEVWLYSLWLE